MSDPLRYICVVCGKEIHLCDRCNYLRHDGRIISGEGTLHLHPPCPSGGEPAPVEVVGALRA